MISDQSGPESLFRLRLVVAYDGTRFHGWQLQAGDRTVQGVVEKALATLTGRPVRAIGSGRTDAGVHALGQVVHADVPGTRAGLPWRRALNALLPEDVAVVEAGPAPLGFHARFGAVRKTYAYTLWTEPEFVYPQRRPFVWACGPVDRQAMALAAQEFLGRRDFAAMQNTGTDVGTTVRTMESVAASPGQTPFETVWRFTADGFLKQMVRNVMGCLVAVGKGKISPADVRSLLSEGDRTRAPATAPARGLCLESVEYGEPGHGEGRSFFDGPAPGRESGG
ncbi:tRNA pseudouridine(38-40) synthase TruA [Desulfovibrio sulfodismutans]|uniref:tRNA pseudouridine synthase A n=1 Tax=Desulfolutivibrio sulfodismutans TaxID=63561 RepID=A0A7K3NK72_9BACT|nr:tRNA pseudouridine(38-40) synthase TruA [Desulfolutivibrio sulfodismutans]NDY56601.1 tRNA pseudouridine(38-40) synthase TruA [Desulfolutivibrio sulfodismutans]QLA13059.1 tRNA pseudouridine(38-40) synthase TruA [Desulfolutivibrio sulfodismutans DSM 3696]